MVEDNTTVEMVRGDRSVINMLSMYAFGIALGVTFTSMAIFWSAWIVGFVLMLVSLYLWR